MAELGVAGDPQGNWAIDVKGLRKTYGRKTVVDGVSLMVPYGSICGFLGPNGSGKTTTIRMLCGLLTPDAGEGVCLGLDLVRDAGSIKLQVGYMPQKFGLYEDLTVQENLYFCARIHAVTDVRAVVAAAMAEMGLTARRAQLSGALSGGWKQRLALAACLIHKPRLLLLDEPTAGVDPSARREFWGVIGSLARSGITVLVSTHYMDEAERCNQIVYLVDGRVMLAGAADELIQQAGLQTWRVSGVDQEMLQRRLQADEAWIAAAFGNGLHVSSTGRRDFPSWVAEHVPKAELVIEPIPPGLEDLFIASARSGSRPVEGSDA